MLKDFDYVKECCDICFGVTQTRMCVSLDLLSYVHVRISFGARLPAPITDCTISTCLACLYVSKECFTVLSHLTHGIGCYVSWVMCHEKLINVQRVSKKRLHAIGHGAKKSDVEI